MVQGCAILSRDEVYTRLKSPVSLITSHQYLLRVWTMAEENVFSRQFSTDDSENRPPAPVLRPEIRMTPSTDDEHPLEFSYALSYFKRPPGKFNPEQYADHVQTIAVFNTVEQFWRVYSHLQRPSDVTEKVDFHLFKTGVKPVWEDDANKNGGKWIVRLKKGLSSRIWENLILAMLGEQFMVGEEICGAVCSIRNQEDIVSLWNRTASDVPTTNRIRDTMRRVLNLPPNTVLEYKRHDDCLKDQTSYRNTDIFRR